METKQINNPLFKVYKLTPEAMEGAQKMGLMFEDFFQQLHALTFDTMAGDKPGWEGREWSIVRTKLEEAAFYAKKAFSQRVGNSE